MLGWGSTSSGFVCSRSTYSGTRCVLKSPCSLLRLGDASYVGCTALHLMATVKSSPCDPVHENIGRNLSHEFVLANSKPHPFVLLYMVIRVASMSSGDFRSFLSGVLIFL